MLNYNRSSSLSFAILFSAVRFNALPLWFFLTLLGFACPHRGPSLHAQTPVPVLTWRYDNTHAGQNTNETVLTPSNVNVNNFGKLFSLTVDSTVYAQPLYVPGLKMSDGNVHNVLFVATENDSIYAFDADSNGGANAKPLWHVTLLDSAHGAGSGATAIPWNQKDAIFGQGDIGPTIGITGTPVINPATNTMYVVGNTEESGAFYSRLHAINIITGAEQTSPKVQKSPVVISATVSGTGTASSAGKLSFDPLVENQRPALDFSTATYTSAMPPMVTSVHGTGGFSLTTPPRCSSPPRCVSRLMVAVRESGHREPACPLTMTLQVAGCSLSPATMHRTM